MKVNLKKKLVVVIAMITLAAGMSGICASAISYKSSTFKNTSGGTAGVVKIRSRVYTDYYQPYSSVNVYYYGVVSEIITGSEYVTTFNITGTVSNKTSSTNISKSGTANSVKAYTTSSFGELYTDWYTTTTTTSSSFGNSSQECNYSYPST